MEGTILARNESEESLTTNHQELPDHKRQDAKNLVSIALLWMFRYTFW
jgi:hypothetical protein